MFTLYLPQTYNPLRGAAPRPRCAAERRIEPVGARRRAEPMPALPAPRWQPVRRPRESTPRRRRGAVRQRGRRRPRRHRPGDRVLLIVENEIGFAKAAARGGARRRLQGPGHRHRRQRADADARVPAQRHHARHPPARHGGLAHPRPPEDRPVDAPHPDLRGLHRRRARARARAGAQRLPRQAAAIGRRGDTALAQLARYVERPRKRLLW